MKEAIQIVERLRKHPGVVEMGIFGSSIREGAKKASDVDLYVRIDEDKRTVVMKLPVLSSPLFQNVTLNCYGGKNKERTPGSFLDLTVFSDNAAFQRFIGFDDKHPVLFTCPKFFRRALTRACARAGFPSPSKAIRDAKRADG